jgi:hypothetical protein
MKIAHFLAAVILGNLVVLAGGYAAAPARDEPLVLTPFEVNEVPEGLPWKYLQTDGYEMITLLPSRHDEGIAIVCPGRIAEASPHLGIVPGLVSRAAADFIFLECRPEPRAWLWEALFGPAGLFEPAGMGSSSERDEMRIASLLWIDEAETEKQKKSLAGVPALIPLDRYFNDPPPDAKTAPAAFALWQSQARLFAHWALLAKKKPAFEASAFWQFANDSRLGPVSEEKFRGYFGRDYATALAELRAYLPVAVKNGVDRAVPGLHEAATKTEFVYRAATESEVGRIKGNFERLEAVRLKESDPTLAKRYEEAARRSLTRATKFMPVDPRVYGVLGLLEFDTNQAADARRHLEISYRDGGLGSCGLLALARLRLDETKGTDAEPAKLKAAELERVLELLFAARERKPALVETYRLIAEVWERSEVQPTRGHLAVLNEGVRFFPWDDALSEKTKALHRRFGYEAEVAATESR